MPAVPQGSHGGGGVTCFDRMKMGFMMGMVVGMCSGGNLVVLSCFLSQILIRRGDFWWIRSFTDGHERRGTGAECGEGDGAGRRNLWDLHGHRNWN